MKSAHQTLAHTMTARNAPCPCGSGKKFRHCHGADPQASNLPKPPMRSALEALRQGLPEQAMEFARSAADSQEKFRLLVHCLISAKSPAQLKQALEWLSRWQEWQPGNPEPLQRELEIHLYQRDLAHAGNSLKNWQALKTGQAETDYYAAVLEQLNDRTDTALGKYSQAIKQQRRLSGQEELGDPELSVAAALQYYETAAGNYPGSPGRNDNGMFGSRHALTQLESALRQWESDPRSGEASPEVRKIHANAWYNLGCASLANFTADDQRIGMFEKALQLDPEHLLARCNYAFSYNYSPTASAAEIFKAHQLAAQWPPGRQSPWLPQRKLAITGTRKIRLAYLSSDFRKHSVAHFILPVLKKHDRSRFEIYIYHNHQHEDAITEDARRLADEFKNIAGLSEQQASELIRADQLDLLIDLNGLTEHHRVELLAGRVAPVQLNWIGYPNTTGLNTMDYRIVDSLTDPRGDSDALCTETLLRLQAPFLAFEPPAELPDITSPPCLESGQITFGSFNALPKLNPALLSNWSGILQQVTNSRLLIKNPGMDYDLPRDQIRKQFAGHGVAGDRIMFAGKSLSQADHLNHYAQVDISLDTYPYHGTTTTCDSLVMGVPVISRAGNEHRSRVGLSLLSSLGLESLVARDENSLVSIAANLAADMQQLRTFRFELRSLLLSSPLCDAARLTAGLETELIKILETGPIIRD